MVETTGHHLVQNALSGVAERRMPEIVPQRRGLREILVQSKPPGDRAGNAIHLQGVGHTGAIMVALRAQKDLRLVLEPPKSLAVDDAIHIPLETGAQFLLFFLAHPPTGPGRKTGRWRQCQPLIGLRAFSVGHFHTPLADLAITKLRFSAGKPSFFSKLF